MIDTRQSVTTTTTTTTNVITTLTIIMIIMLIMLIMIIMQIMLIMLIVRANIHREKQRKQIHNKERVHTKGKEEAYQ